MALVGPTAAGKSELAMRLAKDAGGVILSVDSMQVYRGMDIGTAKPSLADRAAVAHFMVDIIDPSDDFSVAQFQDQGRRVLDDHPDTVVIVTGGSGLHMRALLDPMEFPPHDPQLRTEIENMGPDAARAALVADDRSAAEFIDLANPRRVSRALEILRLTGATPTKRAQTEQFRALRQYRPLVDFVGAGIDAGEALTDRITRRVDEMIDQGLVDEVARLDGRMSVTAEKGVGYKELLSHVRGKASLDEARASLVRSTQALAKRQRTFFGRDPRLTWLAWSNDVDVRYARLVATLDMLG